MLHGRRRRRRLFHDRPYSREYNDGSKTLVSRRLLANPFQCFKRFLARAWRGLKFAPFDPLKVGELVRQEKVDSSISQKIHVRSDALEEYSNCRRERKTVGSREFNQLLMDYTGELVSKHSANTSSSSASLSWSLLKQTLPRILIIRRAEGERER